MITMPQAFMDAFTSDYRDDIRVKALVGATEYTSDAGTIIDMELDESISLGDALPLGECGSSELRITLAGVSPVGLSNITIRPFVTIGEGNA